MFNTTIKKLKTVSIFSKWRWREIDEDDKRITQNYGNFIEKNHEGQQSPGNQVSFSVFFFF